MNNEPKFPDMSSPRKAPRRDGSNIESLVVIAVVLAAVGAMVFYSAGNSSVTATNPPPTTTGQGSPRTMAPVIDQTKPVLPTTPQQVPDDEQSRTAPKQ